MTGWLDASVAGKVIGADLMGDVDADSFAEFVAAARSYVESRRPDLFGSTETVPAPHIVTAASMLALRTYQARTDAASELAKQPDLAAMLGIGKHRRFGFGGAAALPVVEVR